MLIVTAQLACEPPCNTANVCAVTGRPPDTLVCDGGDWVHCDEANRGKTAVCGEQGRRAVCTPSGWAFEPTGPTPAAD